MASAKMNPLKLLSQPKALLMQAAVVGISIVLLKTVAKRVPQLDNLLENGLG